MYTDTIHRVAFFWLHFIFIPLYFMSLIRLPKTVIRSSVPPCLNAENSEISCKFRCCMFKKVHIK